MRLIEIIADAGHTDTLAGIADQHEITDYWWGAAADDGRRAFRMLVNDCKRQLVMDSLQSLFGGSDNVRIVVLPVDTTLPREAQDQSGAAKATRDGADDGRRRENQRDGESCGDRFDGSQRCVHDCPGRFASFPRFVSTFVVIAGSRWSP